MEKIQIVFKDLYLLKYDNTKKITFLNYFCINSICWSFIWCLMQLELRHNTLGILPILYIYVFSKDKKEKAKRKSRRKRR